MKKLIAFSINKPKTVTGIMVGLAVFLALGAILPSVAPQTFPWLNPAQIDTDPENMLSHEEPVRLFHDAMKKKMSLYDMIVVGVVNDAHPEGVFNVDSLAKVHELTEFATQLQWEDPDDPNSRIGVIESDLIAPSTVDNIEQEGPGTIRFEWLMRDPPTTEDEAQAVREKAERISFLDDTLVSEDGKALALYIPISSKDMSYRIAAELRKKVETFDGDEEFHITGLPVAEDTFGVEMFIQMVVCAPLAMLVIFLLMLYFFRKFSLILSPLIVALVSVIYTMALLVIAGNTIHIMSSMIPIFIMPIAVLDAVHILSEFFDRYQETKDRKRTLTAVMETLFAPMLFTSLTTAVGFASLALAPIPPVQVFGLFVAFGVMTAWLWTIIFIPAFIMFIPPQSLENFGLKHNEGEGHTDWMSRILKGLGAFTYKRAVLVLAVSLAAVLVAIYGITRIRINDNPVKWFEPNHPIRVADKVFNEHFGGAYMAYLAFETKSADEPTAAIVQNLSETLNAQGAEVTAAGRAKAGDIFGRLSKHVLEIGADAKNQDALLSALEKIAEDGSFDATDDAEYEGWEEALNFLSDQRQRSEAFKDPTLLRYIDDLQKELKSIKNPEGAPLVGKSNSVTDVVKTVYRELMGGESEHERIPDTRQAVAQSLLQFQNSHRPGDLWHFVTPDYGTANLWVQLKSGDNRDMALVAESINEYIKENPPPIPLHHEWFGLTYINVVWQDKMVKGMFQALMGSFLIVLLMMTFLFRSALWGLLCMAPLSVTICVIYGIIGLIGKDYDMPVAVLSSLSLGLAVDYAIHFLARSRALHDKKGSWKAAVGPVFGEPARAITRNVLVIGVGFTPLLLAPLVPYQTVGIFIAAILLTAGLATLAILPAAITLLEKYLFPETNRVRFSCKCGTCAVVAITATTLIAVNVQQFLEVGYTLLTLLSLAVIAISMSACFFLSRRRNCQTNLQGEE